MNFLMIGVNTLLNQRRSNYLCAASITLDYFCGLKQKRPNAVIWVHTVPSITCFGKDIRQLKILTHP